MSAIDDLLNEIFGSQQPAFRAEFEAWVRGSRRYQAFSGAYRTKIRAKLRNARHAGSEDDLRAELETAAALLREARFEVAYETYAALKQRGPDFTVTYKTHTDFNVEVRRLRGEESDAAAETRVARLMAVLCDKVGQMPPGIVNLLWLIAAGETAAGDIAAAADGLRRMAERNEDGYFARRGFSGAADFRKQYPRLSGIVLRRPDALTVWPNPVARHKLPPEIARAIARL